MIERETIVQELWSRLASVDGVLFTARNPKTRPKITDFPCIQFFELEDVVIKQTSRGGYPVYLRKMGVAVESFITATSEPSATKELGEFIQKVKRKIFAGGLTLGKKCQEIIEMESSRILRPPIGENSVGLGIALDIYYTEDIGKLFI